jgi:hypothetical protein
MNINITKPEIENLLKLCKYICARSDIGQKCQDFSHVNDRRCHYFPLTRIFLFLAETTWRNAPACN